MRRLLLALPLLALAACDAKPAPAAPAAGAVDKAKDPICGMMVDKAGPLKASHEGATYHFCAEACLKRFQAEPAKFAVHCSCGKTSKKCSCGHCGTKGDVCDCN
jgi:YHS domain-containing protein